MLLFLFNIQTPNPPYLLKDPSGDVTLVIAKPTSDKGKGVGTKSIPFACGFCDPTVSFSLSTFAQKHDMGKGRLCFGKNGSPQNLTHSHLKQFSAGNYDEWQFLPIKDLQGWLPCVTHPDAAAPAPAVAPPPPDSVFEPGSVLPTPNPPYLLKTPNGTVSLVLAKATGETGPGPYALKVACGFCDITKPLSFAYFLRHHDTGTRKICHANNNLLPQSPVNQSHLKQFAVGKHEDWEHLPLTHLQGWQPCVIPTEGGNQDSSAVIADPAPDPVPPAVTAPVAAPAASFLAPAATGPPAPVPAPAGAGPPAPAAAPLPALGSFLRIRNRGNEKRFLGRVISTKGEGDTLKHVIRIIGVPTQRRMNLTEEKWQIIKPAFTNAAVAVFSRKSLVDANAVAAAKKVLARDMQEDGANVGDSTAAVSDPAPDAAGAALAAGLAGLDAGEEEEEEDSPKEYASSTDEEVETATKKRKASHTTTRSVTSPSVRLRKKGDKSPPPSKSQIDKWMKNQKEWKGKRANKEDWMEYLKQHHPQVTISQTWTKQQVMQEGFMHHAKKYGIKDPFPDIVGISKSRR